jgi:RNA-directed DNA polymerase
MTTVQAVGAVSSEAAEWYAIEWQAIHRNVRRLQVRIVKAVKEGRWGKVRALQRLLTHSFSGKVLAGSTSDGKPRQENPWCGPRGLGHSREEDASRR